MHSYRELQKHIFKRFGALRDDRQPFEPSWRDIQHYLTPFRGRNLNGRSDGSIGESRGSTSNLDEDTNGADVMLRIYDNSAMRNLDITSAGFMAGVTSPSRPWFKLGIEDKELREDPEIAQYLFDCTEIMQATFGRSNLYKALHHIYAELPSFGTGAMSMEKSFDTALTFKSYTAGEYYCSNDASGKVSVFYRIFAMTVAQMVEEFGYDQCSLAVRNLHDRNQLEQRREILHAVEPHDQQKIKIPLLEGKKYRSVYCEMGAKDDQGPLRIRGFDDFPFLVPRWLTVANQVYGRSIGMAVLPDVKQLQKVTEMKLTIMDKAGSPPVVAPGGSNDLVINTFPDGISYDPDLQDGKLGIRPLFDSSANGALQPILIDIQDLRAQIRAGLYTDLFLMLATSRNPQMTAREVDERHEEKMMVIGPVLESLHDDLLTPLIESSYRMLNELQVLPPPPEKLQGRDLKIEYVSIMATAMRAMGIASVDRFMQAVGGMMSVNPEAGRKVNWDEAVDIYADRLGVPPSLIVPDEVIAEQDAQMKQQQMAQEAALAAETVANTAKTLADTELTTGNALDAITGMAR